MYIYAKRKHTFVLMAGLPGAGKTTLAAILGRTLRFPVIDKDYLKESLLQASFEMVGADTIGHTAYEAAFAFAYDMLVRQQLSAILDTGTLYPFIVKRASEIARAADANLKIILCSADVQTRQERVEKRKSMLLQPVIDTTTVENDLQWFVYLPEDTLILETNRPLKEYVHVALDYLLT